MKYKMIYFILSFSFLIPAEIYKQIRISNVDSDDISLFQVSGIDIDHANYIEGQFIEFAISEIDSRLAIPISSGPRKSACPPNRKNPVSNDIRVRADGFAKTIARVRSLNG